MGDFSANFHRPESGIHTVEGNLAGNRAAFLTKKRQAEQAEFEARKSKLRIDSERASTNIHAKFDVDDSLSSAERTFREKTVGLVTSEEFKKASLEAAMAKKNKRKIGGIGVNLDDENDDSLDNENDLDEDSEITRLKKLEQLKQEKRNRKMQKKALKKKKQMISTLSFADAEDAEGIIDNISSSQITTATSVDDSTECKKNPNVDTSFLPDKKRGEAALAERRRLQQEWYNEQEAVKRELLEITYSYWDGSGHRRTVRVTKGETVGQFLEIVRKDLAREFREMSNVSADALVYVKEDLIVPQDVTFYDLIATKARGKSGPLFNFDVHDDVRVGAVDRTVEKDESHPGKVVERRWYDRNKHIFPASRWEVFDPTKKYGTYTIHGREVN